MLCLSADRAELYPQKQRIFVFLKNLTANVSSGLTRGLDILRASERAGEADARISPSRVFPARTNVKCSPTQHSGCSKIYSNSWNGDWEPATPIIPPNEGEEVREKERRFEY